jgi:hypothetical protein
MRKSKIAGDPLEGFLSTRQVAAELGISRVRVHQMLTAGILQGQRTGMGYWVFTRAAVDSLKKTRRPPGRPKALRRKASAGR